MLVSLRRLDSLLILSWRIPDNKVFSEINSEAIAEEFNSLNTKFKGIVGLNTCAYLIFLINL